MDLMKNRCRYLCYGVLLNYFLKYALLKIYLYNDIQSMFSRKCFSKLKYYFLSVIIQWYLRRKHFTAFYSQGLNLGGIWGAGEENIITLLQAQHTKYPSFDWSGKIKCCSVNCADVQNIIIFNFIKILKKPKKTTTKTRGHKNFCFDSRQFQSFCSSSYLCCNEWALWNCGIYFDGELCASLT